MHGVNARGRLGHGLIYSTQTDRAGRRKLGKFNEEGRARLARMLESYSADVACVKNSD